MWLFFKYFVDFRFINAFFSICSEEKGIPVDSDLGPGSSAATTTANLMTSGVAIAGTTATARQNTTNPLNGVAYSQRYHTLYRKRITLPVFEYRTDFMRLLAENQCIVLVGEVSVPFKISCQFFTRSDRNVLVD